MGMRAAAQTLAGWPVIDASAYLAALGAMLCVGAAGWWYSYRRNNVTIVDSLWPMFFLVALATYSVALPASTSNAQSQIVLGLVAIWAIRLCAYLAWRNWGKAEDHRYAEIRRRNEPGFAKKSLYLVFGLQAVLAWIIATPLAAAYGASSTLDFLAIAGMALWLLGFTFESIADCQLARFKSDAGNAAKVMDRGLWRCTRHPNYFGEACVWWGFWLIAAASGAAWTVFAPLLMTFLLLKVSGVVLLEKDISQRRPGYLNYMKRTNAFIPGPPRGGPHS
jgi:steroid 5-alpha reductase family enzyme